MSRSALQRIVTLAVHAADYRAAQVRVELAALATHIKRSLAQRARADRRMK